MERLILFDSPELVDAVRVWSGWGQFSWPNRDESRLRSKLGVADADRLLPVIKELEQDFYSSEAQLKTSDLAEMGKLAKLQFQRLHPDVAEDIACVFEWCYTFDFK